MRTARYGFLALLAALLLAIPSTALAQDATEPEMMEDPIEAMEPEVDVAEPVAPAVDEVAAQGNAIPQADGIAEGAIAETALDTGATTAPTATVGSGSGELPFTGLDSRQLLQLFLVGSVLLAGGVVSLAWAGARSATAEHSGTFAR
jgi:hypothetical protein